MTDNSKPATSNQPQVPDMLKLIFDNLNAGIVINDENFNIIYINNYLSNIYSRKTTAGQNCFKSLSGAGKQCHGCPIENKIDNFEPVSIEVTGTNSKRYILKIQSIKLKNNQKALLELWIDASEIKKTDHQIYDTAFQLENRVNEQIELIETQRKAMTQQDKLASMGKLVAGVAHEINNPVVFIRSNIEILKKYWEKFEPVLLQSSEESRSAKTGSLSLDDLIKDVPDILGSMYRGTDRIKNIVSNLKSFSRKDAETDKEKVALEEVINEALSLIHSQIKNKMEVASDIDKNLPGIIGNFQRLEQVFVNILMNAFEAGATQLTIKSKKEFNNIIIEIHDNGPGIPNNIIQKVFDPFFTTKGVTGTGLGLSLSFGIIKEHDGSVNVSSEKKNGTIFSIKLPYEAKTILVVDDDLIILDIIKRVLTACGFIVALATNGREAIEKLDTIEPGLILTDIHMPEMDGFQFINWLRSKKKYDALPVLVMTGVEKEIKKINMLHISDYISKPFSTKILADTIKNILKEE